MVTRSCWSSKTVLAFVGRRQHLCHFVQAASCHAVRRKNCRAARHPRKPCRGGGTLASNRSEIFDLDGDAAAVTGGNSGIGFGICVRSAEALWGDACYRWAPGRSQVLRCWPVSLRRGAGYSPSRETSNRNPIARARLEQSVERAGRLDILANNATATRNHRTTIAYRMAKVIDINCHQHSIARIPHIRTWSAPQRQDHHDGSMMSIFGMPFAVAYGASKVNAQ